MVKKTKNESSIDVESLKEVVLNNIPQFISPNGGSLQEIQKEHVKIYNLIFDLIDSLDEKAFIKKEEE